MLRTFAIVLACQVLFATAAAAGCVSVETGDKVGPLFAFSLSLEPGIEIAESSGCTPTVWINTLAFDLSINNPKWIGTVVSYAIGSDLMDVPALGMVLHLEKSDGIAAAAKDAAGEIARFTR